MAVYKTPGVYIEEIPHLPPSISSVETAIPSFVGYTEKAQWKQADDLLNVPWRIESLLEYEQYFGFPCPEAGSLSVIFSSSGLLVRLLPLYCASIIVSICINCCVPCASDFMASCLLSGKV